MPSQTTRQRLIQSALDLFIEQGVSNTTTRQIAAQAEVNEVTLFRHFGNKYGLLLAVIEESSPFTHLGDALAQRLTSASSFEQALKAYANLYLRSLEQAPELIRSFIGEANHFPAENRQALGLRLTEATQALTHYLTTVIQREALSPELPPERLASLLNGLLLGYAAVEFTSEFHQLWQSREDFIQGLAQLFLGAVSARPLEPVAPGSTQQNSPGDQRVLDLPSAVVHLILQQARQSSPQAYALAYVLFAAGLLPQEVIALQRSDQVCDAQQHLLRVQTGQMVRQVPVNQWIWGRRYGSYTSNPLTRWLKSRRDQESSLFLNEAGHPLTAADLDQQWQTWTRDIPMVPGGQVSQAHQTWCVEMLMRGMSLENFSLLTGEDLDQLQPYAQRAREKAALEQAAQLDRKPLSRAGSAGVS
ncbi:MAG: TetR family transcriptional regulator [Elainella sp.]